MHYIHLDELIPKEPYSISQNEPSVRTQCEPLSILHVIYVHTFSS